MDSVYIDGRWQAGTERGIEVFDPSSAAVLATVPSASADQVDAALAAAGRAQPGWAATPAPERGQAIRAIADLVAAHAAELVELLIEEVGKRRPEAEGEVAFAEAFLRYNAEWDRRLEGEVLPGDSREEAIHLLRAPLGVVAAICPWNFPLAVLCRKLGPALVTGNAVVVKPSEVTPLGTLRLMRLIDEELDLPAGVVNLVCGGGETGRAIVRSPRVALVSFTGHKDTGSAIMVDAAPNLTRVALELGGKAPAIVWRDADLDLAVDAIVEARHTNCGQVCTAAERVLVHEAVIDDFTERYVAAVDGLALGDPRSERSGLGPLVSAPQLEKVGAAVTRAVAEGAKVLSGGGRPEGEEFTDGYWHQPTVLGGVTPEMEVMRGETFGPVTPIAPVSSLEEALRIANASRYGLSAYLFSNDYRLVMGTVDKLHFGEIYVNRTLGESIHAHHSGYGDSGMGGEDGKWGLLRYTQIKTAYHHFG